MTRRTRGTNWPLGPLTEEDLPPGIYLVSYHGWERKSYFGQPKIRLDFVIVEPVACAGLVVSLYATCKHDRNQRPSRLGKYYQLWVRVHGSPPQRGQRMTPSIFYGYWQVRVDWGRDKETNQPTTPYVAELLEHVAGGGAV
jgi:hypothetical protein